MNFIPFRSIYDQVPMALRTKMWYNHTNYIGGGTSGAQAEIVYRTLSPRDPFYATGGAYAHGYTVFGQYYRNYATYRAEMTVTFKQLPIYFQTGDSITTADAASQDVLVGVTLTSPQSPMFSTEATLMNDPLTKSVMLVGPKSQATLKLYWDSRYQLGLGPADLANMPGYSSTVNNDPSANWHFHVWRQPAVGLKSQGVFIDVRIVYYTLFYDPITPLVLSGGVGDVEHGIYTQNTDPNVLTIDDEDLAAPVETSALYTGP